MVLALAFLILPVAVTDAFSLGLPVESAVHHHRLSRASEINRPMITTATKSKIFFPMNVKREPLALATNEGDKGKSFSLLSPKAFPKRDTMGLMGWLLAISTFIFINVKTEPYPQSLLLALSRPQWSLVHAISSMVFGGMILLSTLLSIWLYRFKMSPW